MIYNYIILYIMIHNGHFFTLFNLWHLRNSSKFLPFTMVIGLTLFEGKCCISFFLLFELLQLIFCIFQLLEESGLRAWRSCNIAFDTCVCRPFETTDMTCLHSSASDESQNMSTFRRQHELDWCIAALRCWAMMLALVSLSLLRRCTSSWHSSSS